MRTLISALLFTSLLSACGQKGPLYMPHKPPVLAPLPTTTTHITPAAPASSATDGTLPATSENK